MQKVSKEQFDEFVENYPNELIVHTTHIITPPIRTYNDFSAGKEYPDSIVAAITLEYMDDDGNFVNDDEAEKLWLYSIKQDI